MLFRKTPTSERDNFCGSDVTANDSLEHYLRNKRNWYKSST
ncbi:hypothetical protein [Drancourtella sp. An12]|nr:hypothetical protein [Drancourtella sp. An12]